MAIETTTFYYPTVPKSNIDEVYNWLVENAAEYFPGGIVKDTMQWRISCYQVSGDVHSIIVIPFYPARTEDLGYIYTKYGTDVVNVSPNANSWNANGYSKAVKTSCGFVLVANALKATWFVSRTNEGSICTFVVGSNAINTSYISFVLADLENDGEIIRRGGDKSSVYDLYDPFEYQNNIGVTALVPMCFKCGTYSTDLLMTPFTQANFRGDPQKVLIDNQEYIYDGFVALKA